MTNPSPDIDPASHKGRDGRERFDQTDIQGNEENEGECGTGLVTNH